jgi:hypothetical protein
LAACYLNESGRQEAACVGFARARGDIERQADYFTPTTSRVIVSPAWMGARRGAARSTLNGVDPPGKIFLRVGKIRIATPALSR